MEKTTRDIPPIARPPESMKDQQYAKFRKEFFSCKNCFHSYVSEARPGITARLCQHSPPNFQLVQMPGGMGAQIVPRLVPDDYFCHQHVSPSGITTEYKKV